MEKNTQRRKALNDAYKERTVTGCVYRIVCRETGRFILLSSDEMQGAKNRFTFAQSNGTCLIPHLRGDWDAHGPQSFQLEVLETMERKPDQSAAQFREDIALLETIWREKTDLSLHY